MEQRKFGNTVLSVPVIGMGTWRTFDVQGQEPQERRMEIVKAAFEGGATFFDSSPMYGQAERVLGQAVEMLGIRDRVLIATKVWTAFEAESEQQLNRALAYFGGYIDFYQVHNLVEWPTRLSQLERLKASGKVRSIGVTHYSHGAFDEIARIMRSGRIEGVQIPYNALDREAQKELLPLAEELGIGVVVMRPFGEGTLVRRTPSPSQLAPFREWGCHNWPQVLLKWLASDPRVSVIIPATSRPDRMIQNAQAGDPPWFDEATREKVTRLARQIA